MVVCYLRTAVTATTECVTEIGKVHRAAILKVSGCIKSTSTDALEVLTDAFPFDLHLKMGQAQEVVRISVKHEDPLKKDFQKWAANSNSYGQKPTVKC